MTAATQAETTQSQGRQRRQYAELLLASFVGLYFEMLLVRWLAAEVRLFSYFKNLTMMAAFMGLGIGFALARRRRNLWQWFIPMMLLYVPVVLAVSHLTGFTGLIIPESGEYVWRPAAIPAAISTPLFALMVVLFFVYTVVLFVPPGQLTGRLMVGLPPLSAYMVNILGSLAGIWAFAAVSYLQVPPWIWFGLGLVVTLWFLRGSRRALIGSLVAGVGIVLLLAFTQGDTLWSPYYRVDIQDVHIEGQPVMNPKEEGYHLTVNQIGHMDAVNLSEEYLASHPDYANALRYFGMIYNMPYKLVQPERVLVVGAGMGNDVAAALRHGAQQVDAVEIDPLIYELGTRLHPERPYDNASVNVIIDDARAYMEKTDEKYDLIVFGILDSQTMLSGMSSVRLDNFVYTVESLEQARDRLSEDGVIALTFFVERWWIKQRLAQTLEQVFGEPPIQLGVTGTPWTVYLSGYTARPGVIEAACEDLGCKVERPMGFDPVPLATDDWPYLYLQDRGIPIAYWVVLLIVVAVAWFSTRKAFPGAQGMNWHFFCLGGAFLLIEFKSITELALLFGSTWIVNAIAVSAVLVMVLFANLLVANLKRVNLTVLYVLLFLALVVGFATPLDLLLPYGTAVRIVAASLLMGLPLFFAAAIFATSLKETKEVTLAFASNFFGSAVGGVLEYGSLMFGIGSLYLFGAVLYVASWLTRKRA